MIHYSCDRCKRELDPSQELRYIVKIDAQVAMEPLEDQESPDDRDYLEEVQELLEELTDSDDDDIALGLPVQKRFDLCLDCYRKFLQNPLGEPLQLGFSNN
jgi:hypothetical protein